MSVKVTNSRIEEAIGTFAVDVLSARADKARIRASTLARQLLTLGVNELGINISMLREGIGKGYLFSDMAGIRVTEHMDYPGSDDLEVEGGVNFSFREFQRELWKCNTDWSYDIFKLELPEGTIVPNAVEFFLREVMFFRLDYKNYIEDWGPGGHMLDTDEEKIAEQKVQAVRAFSDKHNDILEEYTAALRAVVKINDDMDRLISATVNAVGQKRSMKTLEDAVPELMPYLREIMERDNAPKIACEAEGSDLADLANCMRVKEDC